MKFAALIAVVAARHHHHHHHETLIATHADDMAELNSMSESKLVSSLQATLDQALAAEARDDKSAAVAKTAAIKNIQKALTARILKRLDDGQPLVEVARKMKAIEGMQPQINDMERRLGIMQSVEPVLENAIKTLQKVVDVRGMGKALIQVGDDLPTSIGYNNNKLDCKAIEKNADSKALATREEWDWCMGKHTDGNTKLDEDGSDKDPERLLNKADGEAAGSEGARAMQNADAAEEKANKIANSNKGAVVKAAEGAEKKKENDKKFSKPKEEKKAAEPSKEEKMPETPPEPPKEEEEVVLRMYKSKHPSSKKVKDSEGDSEDDDDDDE